MVENAFDFFLGYHRFAIWLTIWGSALFQPSMNACLDTCSTFIWIFCMVVSLRLKKNAHLVQRTKFFFVLQKDLPFDWSTNFVFLYQMLWFGVQFLSDLILHFVQVTSITPKKQGRYNELYLISYLEFF